jgi:hypothetical protein
MLRRFKGFGLDAGVKALVVRDWGLRLERRVLSLKPSHILVRIAYARLTQLDIAVAQHPHFYREDTIVGFSGVGFAVEAGVDVEEAFQGPVTIRGFDPSFIPPVNADGFAAEYASIPANLTTKLSKADPRYAYLVDSCIAVEAYESIRSQAVSDTILILGGGPSSMMLALLLVDSGYPIEIVTHDKLCRRIIREEIGVQPVDKPTGSFYGAIYLAKLDENYYLNEIIGSTNTLLVLHPHVHALIGTLRLPLAAERIAIKIAWGTGPNMGLCRSGLEKLWNVIGSHVPTVDGLNPPPFISCLGVLLNVRASP